MKIHRCAFRPAAKRTGTQAGPYGKGGTLFHTNNPLSRVGDGLCAVPEEPSMCIAPGTKRTGTQAGPYAVY